MPDSSAGSRQTRCRGSSMDAIAFGGMHVSEEATILQDPSG
jgi:hypothetical protein